MQIGQVPTMFVPEPVVNDTRAITVEAETNDIITPSRPGEAPPVVVVDEGPAVAPWVWIAVGVGLLWFMRRPRF